MIQEVIDFWFGVEDFGKPRLQWFTVDPKFDELIRKNYFDLYQSAVSGKLEHWKDSSEGSLALIILLDQFSRNLYRNSPMSFEQDSKALELAKFALSMKYDEKFPALVRTFFYLPFMHSENIEDQEICVELYEKVKDSDFCLKPYEFALKHQEVIQKFGRFPHRNLDLERESTQEEIKYLQENPSGF